MDGRKEFEQLDETIKNAILNGKGKLVTEYEKTIHEFIKSGKLNYYLNLEHKKFFLIWIISKGNWFINCVIDSN